MNSNSIGRIRYDEVKVNGSGNLTATLNNAADASTYLVEGDLYLSNANNVVSFLRTLNSFTAISIANDGAVIEHNSNSTPLIYAGIDSGNFGLSENGAGIVFRNAKSDCWKLHVDEEGNISTGLVPCN